VGHLATAYRALAAVFANPDLRRLQLAWAGMSFATWAYAIALGVYAFDVGGGTAVGLVALVRLLPGALASPFAGVLGDRHSRRAVMIASSLASAAALAASAWAGAMAAPAALVFALAALFTVVSSAYVPAEGAVAPLLARTPQELSAANIAHSVMDNLGFLSGSIIAGVLLATTSPQSVFAAAAALAAAATDARSMRTSPSSPAPCARPSSAFGACGRIVGCGCSAALSRSCSSSRAPRTSWSWWWPSSSSG
jgi:MFS family permease